MVVNKGRDLRRAIVEETSNSRKGGREGVSQQGASVKDKLKLRLGNSLIDLCVKTQHNKLVLEPEGNMQMFFNCGMNGTHADECPIMHSLTMHVLSRCSDPKCRHVQARYQSLRALTNERSL